jgi:internalin A
LLDIDDNPLESPPEEIRKQGKDAVLRFLRELEEQGARELFEVKMLIVVGRRNGQNNPLESVAKPQSSGAGYQLKNRRLVSRLKKVGVLGHLDRPDDTFLVNLWDFGGQDIQYMTHQFFLTRRSFYVLLADGRREVANFSYWLQIIELLGCDQDE